MFWHVYTTVVVIGGRGCSPRTYLPNVRREKLEKHKWLLLFLLLSAFSPCVRMTLAVQTSFSNFAPDTIAIVFSASEMNELTPTLPLVWNVKLEQQLLRYRVATSLSSGITGQGNCGGLFWGLCHLDCSTTRSAVGIACLELLEAKDQAKDSCT